MRSYPLNQGTENSNVYINGLNISAQNSEYTGALANCRFYHEETNRQLFSSAFTAPDREQFFSYEGPAGDQAAGVGARQPETNNQFTNDYMSFNRYFESQRSSPVYYRVQSNPLITAGAAGHVKTVTFRVEWYEPLLVSPFIQPWSKSDSAGLGGINNILVTLQTNVSKMFAINPYMLVGTDYGAAAPGGDPVFGDDPNLILNVSFKQFLTADMIMCYLTPSSILGLIE